MSERIPEQDLLAEAETIAVVGLSRNPKRDSHIVANHLKRNGYRIVPIHPKADTILGETAYPTLADVPDDLAAEIDIVDIFRPAEEVPGIVEEAVEHLPNLRGIWTQKDITSEAGAEAAAAAGVTFVQDRCIRTQDLFRKFGAAKQDVEVA